MKTDTVFQSVKILCLQLRAALADAMAAGTLTFDSSRLCIGGPGREIRLRVEYRVDTPVLAWPWTARIDREMIRYVK